MSNRCPVCLQPIPAGISPTAIQARIQKLASPALEAERKKLQKEFATKLNTAQEAAQQKLKREFQIELRAVEARARQDAERGVKAQLANAEKRASQAEDRMRKEIDRARKQEQARLKSEIALAVSRNEQKNEAALEKVQVLREREKARNEETVENLKGKLEDLTRKLEMRSAEQLGTEAEIDLYTALSSAFPEDRIGRIGKGVKGADIEHKVMDGAKVAGVIIYESKNTSDWNKSFIAQAKKYRTQYATPHVMIVSRAFPPKRKGLCVDCGIPIVEARMAISLAAIIREGVVAIGKLKLTGTFNAAKSQELYEYIVSDNFCTHFGEIADQIDSLRNSQLKEKASHERMWQEESNIHERIQGSHRKVDAQINAIVRSDSSKGKNALPAEMWRGSQNGEAYTA